MGPSGSRRGARRAVPRRPARSPAGALTAAGAACLLGALIVGLELDEDWQVLFLPAGVLLALAGALIALRAEPHGGAALALGLGGLACVGLGLEHLDPDPSWSWATLPAIVVGGLWCLREAIRGRRSSFVADEDDAYDRWRVRLGLWMFGLTWPLLALWALDLT